MKNGGTGGIADGQNRRTNMKRRYSWWLVIVLAIVLMVTICGCTPKITQGEVVDKQFEPAHTVIRIIPLPYVYHYPDTYRITITALDEDGNRQKATYRVTKEVFETVQIGDEFIYTKDMEPSEPEYRREEQEG